MSAPVPALALALVALMLPAAGAVAEPAATADSAWSALPAAAGERPDNPVERRGREVFDQRCAACHGPIPAEIFGPVFVPLMPGTQALLARYRGELPALLEERTDLTAERIRSVVRNGFVSMSPFRPTEVSEEDLEALVAYLTRHGDGDAVRPAATAAEDQ